MKTTTRFITALATLGSLAAFSACSNGADHSNPATYDAAPPASTAGVSTPTTATATSAATLPETTGELQRLIDADLARFPTIPGELIHVLSASRGIDVAVAGGVDDVTTRSALPTDSAVRIASVTKTFTAAAILRLVETNRLNLNDNLATAGVPADLLEILRTDGYDTNAITVEQLLSHTSGIADFADNDRGVVGGAYADAVLSDPSHEWTRAEQVQFAVDHHDRLAAPGLEYHYSDTGYDLLGAIVEARTNQSFGAALRELLRFDVLGLDSTFVDDGTDHAVKVVHRAHQYVGDVDAAIVSPTIDLNGGGGIVTTMSDLARFYSALLGGHVFDDDETLKTMTTVASAASTEQSALGIYRVAVGPSTCWFHAAFWGVAALTCPDLDMTISLSWNQAVPPEGFDLSQHLLAIADKVLTASPARAA